MKTLRMLLLKIAFLLPIFSIAQNKFDNTIKADSLMPSPKANLEILKSVAGLWEGQAFGGVTQECWSPPLAGSMMCTFKLVVGGEIKFYEICTIAEVDSSLVIRLKHFDKNLKGWEDKNGSIEFKLVKVTPKKIYFDGFTFEMISKNEMNIYVIIEDKGKESEVKFNYKRVKL